MGYPNCTFRPRACMICGTEFTPTTPTHSLCSAECVRQRKCDRATAARRANPERVRASQKRLRDKPGMREILAARHAAWLEKNPDASREATRAWRRKNPGAASAAAMQRRMDKLQRTPPWVDREVIKYVYLVARSYRDAGINVHVDHIVPLRGETVSGLHVPWNLQIIPAKENLRKGNRHAS